MKLKTSTKVHSKLGGSLGQNARIERNELTAVTPPPLRSTDNKGIASLYPSLGLPLHRTLPVLGILLFFTFFTSFLLLSCDDLESDNDDSAPKFSVDVLAGSGTQGSNDGEGTAQFNIPYGIAVASSGTIYVADVGNSNIRKITSDGTVTTFAGSGTSGSADGQGTAAQFRLPYGITVASSGTIYVADTNNHRIRKITALGEVTTFAGSGTSGSADGQGTVAQFNSPYGLAVAFDGTLYVADTSNNRIRKITSEGTVTTFAGSTSGFANGQGTAAQFSSPSGIAVASDGTLYVADTLNNRIRKITSEGTVTTLAGSTQGSNDGEGTAAQFAGPYRIAVASDGTLYVADTSNNRIRKITSEGTVTSIVKDLNNPRDIALSPDGSTAYVANTNSAQILKLSNLLRAGSALELTLESPETSVVVGSKISFTATSNIPGAAAPTWKVIPTGGNAEIDEKGVLTGVSAGTVTVRVTINGLKKDVKVTVSAS